MNFTDAQYKAITAFEKDIIVSAGAGSGKTRVLTERILYAVRHEKCSVDELLVVTFTNATTAEMRKRIRDGLYKAYREDRSNSYLAAQIAKIDSAQISTFHAFCSSVIKKYYYAAGIDPSFVMLGDNEQSFLRSEAMETLLEYYYDKNDSEFELLENTYNDFTDSEKFKATIFKLYDYTRKRKDGIQTLHKLADNFDLSSPEAFESSEEIKAIKEIIKACLNKAESYLSEAYALSVKYADKDNKWPAFIAEDVSALTALRLKFDDGLESFIAALDDFKLQKFSIRVSIEVREEIKAYRDAAAEEIKTLQNMLIFSFDDYYRFSKELAPNMLKLAEIAEKYDEIYTSLKAERHSADFDDLQIWCMQILDDEECLNEIKSTYKYVLVDEYQDTNPVQEYVLTRVAKENSLFVVGDMKQAIYRFNEAEPKIFLNRYDKAADDSANDELIIMAENFRTQTPVIEAVNELFAKIMFRETGGIDYAPNEALIAQLETEKSFKPEIHAIVTDEKSENDLHLTDLEREAAYVAKLVKKTLSEQIYDAKEFIYKDVKPSDIAILARSMNSQAETYARALEAENIPVSTAGDTSFYDTIEISLALNILRLIDNERDDIALLSVMRSFIFAFTPDELLKIRLKSPLYHYYYDCIYEYIASGEDDIINDKLNYMFSKIHAYRKSAKHISIEELLRNIYSETNLYRIMGALPNGEGRRNNLKRMLNLASSYEKNTFKGLYSFINFIDNAIEEGKFKLDNAVINSNGVKILTVHKSKGLEFPVVIVADLGKSLNKSGSNTAAISVDNELGLCPVYINTEESYSCDTLQSVIYNFKNKKEDKAEEMRILYVAATRAEARLIFTGKVSAKKFEEYKEGINAVNLSGVSSNIEYLLRAAAGSDKWNIIRAGEEGTTQEPAEIKEGLSANETAEDKITLTYDEIKSRAAKLIDYKYPYETDFTMPSKLTVSAMKNNELMPIGEKVIRLNEEPAFTETESTLTGAERGTLTHEFLNELNYKEIDKDDIEASLKVKLEDLVSKAKFTKEEAKAINLKNIARFLKSELGGYLLNCDEVKSEMPFILKLDPKEADSAWEGSTRYILLQGIIDCVFKYKGNTYLIDYKTDYFKDEESFNLTHQSYLRQIELYDKALTLLYGKPADKRYICYLSMGRVIEV